MHIAFFYPQIKKLTGAQRLMLKLAEYVVRDGHQVSIVTHRMTTECRDAVARGVYVVETSLRVDRLGSHYLDAALEYALGPALVHHLPAADAICFFGPPSLPALGWARRVRGSTTPLVYFCYEPPRASYTDRETVARHFGPAGPLVATALQLYRPADRALARMADAIAVNGEFGRQLVREAYGVDATVIPHGVDFAEPSADEIQDLRDRLGLRPPDQMLLTVNQLHPRKRIDLFLRALARARQSLPEIRGVVVGAGLQEAELRTLARDLGLAEAVSFAGFVDDADLPAYYAAAAVYVHTGRLESFGLSVIEALASGTPVVSVGEGGPARTVSPGRTGYLVEATAEEIARAVTALLADQPRAARMGETARTEARQRYRWELGAQRLLEVCTRPAATRPGGVAGAPAS